MSHVCTVATVVDLKLFVDLIGVVVYKGRVKQA
jgi:hypothetical protein